MSEIEKARVLVTGATGFIGSALVEALAQSAVREPVLALRRPPSNSPAHPYTVVGDLAPETDWREALQYCKAVVHCAARAHILKDEVAEPLAEYRKVNVEGTHNLARQAAKAGVRSFIFISSIGVNGDLNTRPFTEEDAPNPAEPYAQSKWEAEQCLWHIQRDTGMDVVIIRSPLVYGPNAPGNFDKLIKWVARGVPMPFGAVHNKRSLVALDNLVDLVLTCLDQPAAANQLFLAGDGEDLSTTELLRRLSLALGKSPRLLPVPAGLLEGAAGLLGKEVAARRLCGSLRVDIGKARDRLGWQPPVSVNAALKKTARSFLDSQSAP